MEGKAGLVPNHYIPHVRTVHHDFCPDTSLRPRYGISRGRFSVITSHGKSQTSMIPVLSLILIVLHLVVGPRVLSDSIRREISRPCPTRHTPTCKHRQTTVQPRHWFSETLVAPSTNDQRLELDRLLNPLFVPTYSLSHPPSLPRNSCHTHPFLRSRGIGLRVCKNRFTNLALTVVAPLHRIGRLRCPAWRRGD